MSDILTEVVGAIVHDVCVTERLLAQMAALAEVAAQIVKVADFDPETSPEIGAVLDSITAAMTSLGSGIDFVQTRQQVRLAKLASEAS